MITSSLSMESLTHLSKRQGGILMPLCVETWDYMPTIKDTLPYNAALLNSLKNLKKLYPL